MRRLTSTEEISHETARLLVQILQTNIEAETELQGIIRTLRKDDTLQLFSLINSEHSGFISYQELKNYLSSFGVNSNMSDLMAILKRFDRNKNGVILEEEFVRVLSC
jgi:Ca2+-binding EF-hand superfamily protein